MTALPPPSPLGFVLAMRRYIGALEYRPRKSCFVVETPSGPRGFTDCAGLPLLALRDIGLLSSDFDPNFPLSMNREGEILRVLRHLAKQRLPEGEGLRIGDIAVTGGRGQFHVMVVSRVSFIRPHVSVIESPHAHGLVCERTIDDYELEAWRSVFRLF